MNRDDIIRWAKQSGWKRVGHNPDTGPEFPVLIGNLERFAALVAAAEREACAKVCEARKIIDPEYEYDRHYNQGAEHCAFAIRARGEA